METLTTHPKSCSASREIVTRVDAMGSKMALAMASVGVKLRFRGPRCFHYFLAFAWWSLPWSYYLQGTCELID